MLFHTVVMEWSIRELVHIIQSINQGSFVIVAMIQKYDFTNLQVVNS